MTREIIYPKDIMIITGKCLKSSQRLLRRMKKHFGKKKYQYISPQECSEYLGLNRQKILAVLKT